MKKLLFLTATLLLSYYSFSRKMVILPTTNHTIHQPIKYSGCDSVISIFKNLDLQILQSNDSVQIENYLKQINQDLIDCLSDKFPNNLPLDSVDVNDPMTLWMGLAYAISERTSFHHYGETSKMPVWLQCIGDVVLGYFNVVEIINQLTADITFSSAWSLIKKLIRRYAGWLSAAWLLYDIATNCL